MPPAPAPAPAPAAPSALAVVSLAVLRQEADAPARPESGALVPLLVGLALLGLLVGVLRFLYVRARGPRRRLD